MKVRRVVLSTRVDENAHRASFGNFRHGMDCVIGRSVSQQPACLAETGWSGENHCTEENEGNKESGISENS